MACTCRADANPLREQGESLFQRAGLTEIAHHVVQIEADVSSAHRRLRRVERAAALGVPFSAGVEVTPDVFFARARRHADRVRSEFARVLRSEGWEEIRGGFSPNTEQFSAALSELRATFLEGMDRADISVADSREMAAAFDQVADLSRESGIDGIAAFLDEQFRQFDDILTEERNWGREGHSPLEWWQWLVIIGVLVITIAALIACLWWFGCSWIAAIWAFFCAGATVTGGVWAGLCLAIVF